MPFLQRFEALCKLYDLEAYHNNITINGLKESNMFFLGGFVLGEGSVNVSLKVQEDARFGFNISPQFSVTQHVTGIKNLLDLMFYFKCGRIAHKQGSANTFVFAIENRKVLLEKVYPFYETYVFPFCGETKMSKVLEFYKLVTLLESKQHLSAVSMAT